MNTMKRKVIIIVVLMFILTVLSGCKTVYVPVDRVHTEYRDRIQQDSIYIRDSVYVREKGDTVWFTRWRVEFRDRIKVDSIHIHDSVPVPYPVEVIKTVEKKLTWWQRVKMETGGITLCVLLVLILILAVNVYRIIKSKGWKGIFGFLLKK